MHIQCLSLHNLIVQLRHSGKMLTDKSTKTKN